MGRISLALAVIVALAACTDDEPATSPSSTSRATTTTVTRDLAPFTGDGPYAVGTYTAEVDGRRLVIWYPADPDAAADQPKESFDLVSLFPPEEQAQVPSELRVPYEVDAHPGAEPARGRRYPVVVFVHDVTGFPEQSVDLTTHLAGWGFIVMAPEHVEQTRVGDPLDPLQETLDRAEQEDRRPGSPLEGIVDLDRVAVTGHSAGAATAYRFAATDDRVDAYVGYAVPAVDGPVPDVPAMVMLATRDGIVAPSESRTVFDGLSPSRYLVEVEGAGSLVFTDLCAMGEPFLAIVDVPPPLQQLRASLTQGCTGDFPPIADDQAAIDDLSVDFLRTTLGQQDEPVGLDDPSVAEAFDARIGVTADP